jgi:hypothetical protein
MSTEDVCAQGLFLPDLSERLSENTGWCPVIHTVIQSDHMRLTRRWSGQHQTLHYVSDPNKYKYMTIT